MTPGPALPLPLPRHCRILGKAVARLGSCCGLGSCLFQIKKAASERARCFAQIAKGACAAAPPVQIILNFRGLIQLCRPCRASGEPLPGRGSGAGEAAAAQGVAKAAGASPSQPAPLHTQRSPKYRGQVRSAGRERLSLLPLKARLTHGKDFVFWSG